MKVFVQGFPRAGKMTLDAYNALVADGFKLYKFSTIDNYGSPWNIFMWSTYKVDDVRSYLADKYAGDYMSIEDCKEVTDEYKQYPEA